jgi:3',5'-cyclic AMP phosphodiesterase CpdA
MATLPAKKALKAAARPRRITPLAVFLISALALSALSLYRTAAGTPPTSIGTVAVGDVHGDVERFVAVLHHAGILDSKSAWAGDDRHLVLTGDLVDRGSRSREVLDLVMRLEREAPDRVHVLLGNHEVLNMLGDLRYVPKEEYRAYAGAGSEDLRTSRYESWLEFQRSRARRLGFPETSADGGARAAWMSSHPPGFFERRQAFGAEGTYGRWFRELDAARLAEGVLYAHGGPSAERPFPSVDALNEEVRHELTRFDQLWSGLARAGVLWPDLTWGEALPLVREELNLWEAIDSLPAEKVDPAALKLRPSDETLEGMRELLGSATWAVMDSLGPLWYRGLANLPDAALAPKLDGILAAYRAEHVVVGHTPTADSRVHERLGGKVFLIDTGLASAVGGRPSALEIRDGRFSALYLGEEPVVLWPVGGAQRTGHAGEPAGVGSGGTRFAVALTDTPPARTLADAKPAVAATRYDAFHGLTEPEIEAFLREAPVAEVRKIGAGVTKPSRAILDDGRTRHDAAIQSVDACEETKTADGRHETTCDSYKYNLAAYEIGKLLDLTSIPPSVERKFGGRSSAFTWWIDDVVTLANMKARGLRQPDMQDWNRQQWTVGIFDELIFNTDRNQGNLLVDPAWRVWMIDHTRAFRVGPRLRRPDLLAKMHIDPALLTHLRALTAKDLEQCCKAYLTSDERKSVLVRRDSIVARLGGP